MAATRYNQFHPLLLDYIERALELIDSNSEESKVAVWFLAKNQKMLGLSFPKSFPVSEPYKRRKSTEDIEAAGDEVWTAGIRTKRYQKAIEVVQRSQVSIEATSVKSLQFFKNLEFFKGQAGLDDTDTKILTFYAAVKREAFFTNIFNGTRDWADEDDYFRALGTLTVC